MSFILQGSVGLKDVLVTRTGGNTLSNAAGVFSFTDVPGEEITITPTKAGVTFTPPSQTLTPTEDQFHFDLDCNGSVRVANKLNDGSLVFSGLFTEVTGVQRNGLAKTTPIGLLDLNFAPNFTGNVDVIAHQSDDSIILGGSLTSGDQQYLIRVSPEGVIDETFTPQINGFITALRVQDDDKILISGWFTEVNGESHQHLARLNADGSLDSTFTAFCNEPCTAIKSQPNGSIILGGLFTSVNGTVRNYLARVTSTGSLDAGYDPNLNGAVYSLALDEDVRCVCGGEFTTVGGVTRTYLARINNDGTLNTTLDVTLDAAVYAVDIYYLPPQSPFQGGWAIMIGGLFTTVDGVSQPYTARLIENTLDTNYDPQIDAASLKVLLYHENKLIIYGYFTEVNSEDHSGIVSLDLLGDIVTGLVFEAEITEYTLTYTAGANGSVLGTSPQTIQYGSNGTEVLASADAGYAFEKWSDDSTQNPRKDLNVTDDITVTASFVPKYTLTYLGGSDGSIIGPTPQTVVQGKDGVQVFAQPDPEMVFFEWSDGSTQNPRKDLNVQANITVTANYFSENKTLTHLVQGEVGVSGVTVVETESGINTQSDATGFFIFEVNEGPCVFEPYKEGWAFDPPSISLNVSETILHYRGVVSGGSVRAAVKQPDGKVIIVGGFTHVNGVPKAYIARLLPDGSLDTSFNPPSPTGVLHTVGLQSDGKVVAAGWQYIRQYNSSGTLLKGRTSNQVWSMIVQSDDTIVVGGGFTTMAGETRNYLARFDADLTLLPAFTDEPNGAVLTIAKHSNGVFVVGGEFTQLGPWGITAYLGRYTENGEYLPWTYDNYIFNGVVRGVAVLSNHAVVIVGDFTQYRIGGSGTLYPRKRATIIDYSGNMQSTLDLDISNRVDMVNIDSSDRIYLSGLFTSIEGILRNRFARLSQSSNYAVDETYDLQLDGLQRVKPLLPDDGLLGSYDTFDDTTYWAKFDDVGNRIVSPLIFEPTFITYNLQYSAGDHGSIYGSVSQTVAYGEDGSTVIAVPNSGYTFVQWSDGVTEAERTDLNVTEDISVTAFFEEIEELEYTRIIQGNVEVDSALIRSGDYTSISEIGGNFTLPVNAAQHTVTPTKEGVSFDPLSIDTDTTDGSILFWGHHFNGIILCAEVINDFLYVGGLFTEVDGVSRLRAARFTLEGQLTTWDPAFDPQISSVTPGHGVTCFCESLAFPGEIYVGGSFSKVGHATAHNLVRIAGLYTVTYAASLAHTVHSVLTLATEFQSHIIVGLNGGIHLGSWTEGSLHLQTPTSTFLSTHRPDGPVYKIVSAGAESQSFYAVGMWSKTGPYENWRSAAKYTYSDNAFRAVDGWGIDGATLNKSVRDAVRDGSGGLYIVGNFNFVNGNVTRYGFARLTPGGVIEDLRIDAINPDGYMMRSIHRDGDKLYIGGNFTAVRLGAQFVVDPIARTNFALITGCPGTPVVDSTWILEPNGQPWVITDLGQQIFIGGGFTEILGESVGYSTLLDNGDFSGLRFSASIATHTLTYLAGEGGSISGEAIQEVEYLGNGSQVEALPNEGYIFVMWDDGDTNPARQEVLVTSDKTVTALFTIKEYTLEYLAGAGGTVEGDTVQLVPHGFVGTPVTAVPDSGQDFFMWSDGVLTATRTDTALEDMQVTALFSKVYTVQYSVQGGGSISGDTYQLVVEGEDATPVEAVDNAPYGIFSHWSDGKTNRTRQELNVTANLNFTAVFTTKGEFIIHSNISSSFYIQGVEYPTNTPHLFEPGTYTVTFKPQAGYETPSPRNCTITGGTLQECTIEYTSSTQEIEIRGNVGLGGVSIGNTTSLENGEYVVTVSYGETITLTPELPGYHFCPCSRTFTNVTTNFYNQDHVAHLGEAPETVLLTLNVQGSGTVVGAGEYPFDSEAEIIAHPHTGWEFVEWSDGNTAPIRTLTMVNNYTLTAIFARSEYTIETTSTSGGSASPAEQTRQYEETGIVEAFTDPNYAFIGWYLGESRQSTMATYTFIATQSMSLEARFVLSSSLPAEEKEVVGIMTAELGVDEIATIGTALAIGVERQNDTDAIREDQQYLLLERGVEHYELSLQQGKIEAPTTREVLITFGEDTVIDRIAGDLLSYEGANIDQALINTLTVTDSIHSSIISLTADINEAVINTLTVTGTALFKQGPDLYMDSLFVTGYLNIGQGEAHKLRPGGLRYTGALRSEIIGIDGNEVTFDESYTDIVGKTVILRGGEVEYAIVSGSGSVYILDGVAALGECIILTEGNWQGWTGDHWVSFAQSAATPMALSTGTLEERVDRIEEILVNFGFAI